MQNPISPSYLRQLFQPQRLDKPEPAPNRLHQINPLSQMMPLDQVTWALTKAHRQRQPLYITVSRQLANMNTKDILFGFVESDISKSGMVAFKVDGSSVSRLIHINHILAFKWPQA
ncbi:hypothetical protein AWM75_02745 [Aerococcus urinaehominis]|uniref:Uncharacterized protein n=1 Tax=Aerococcus urinaehominis TaxID=128944 RepID=A0A120IAS7_9LACT|nr:hypothetical protein [Aerococcus urinaehominis]AMB98980.1 hypothetical protein AWM75_02745 [Aerococcus urinaehominis]SDM37725.1 hypothetical protein SAMN04487985_11425 [Aerococcus urinaehominis]